MQITWAALIFRRLRHRDLKDRAPYGLQAREKEKNIRGRNCNNVR